jgi:simple sugar transport system permease protein
MGDVDDQADEPAASSESGSRKKDERLSHRGPFQRLLAQPETGAMIGAITIWSFFWAVTEKFGTAAGAQGILDVSATLGIMAVAVAMLMIGGEFDLSSGAMTGATGLLAIYLALEVGNLGGAGLNLWLAIPISLLFALGIGWFNGTMVERTGLPSFIVTLGTFFILKGVKLGFAKLLIDNIQVGPLPREGNGYDFWQKVFAAEWTRNDHEFGGRDALYTSLALLGICLMVVALHELNHVRRTSMESSGLAIMGAGVVAAIAGYLQLHNTDGVAANITWGGLLGLGVVVALYGWSHWRYEPQSNPGSLVLKAEIIRPAAAGVVLMIVGVVSARLFNSNNDDRVFLLLTEQGLRALLLVGLVVGGMMLLAIAAFRAGLVSALSRSAVLLVSVALTVWLAYMVQVESNSSKFRAQLFTVMLVGALVVFSWAITSLRFEQRQFADRHADRFGRRLGAFGVLLVAIGVTVRLLFISASELEDGLPPAKFSVRILWFIGFTVVATWVLGNTKFGGWTFAVGGNKMAARQVGVPAARTKTQLFMLVSAAAWLVGMLLAFRLNSLQAGTGDGLEFEYIIAAVVGGNLLTGGYGSALGAAIGALIMAMSRQGIPFALWNTDWRFVFLGVILLLAAIGNNFIKTKAENLRKG